MRIDDNYLRGNRVDGEVITSSDFNELETVVKAAINANYTDIVSNSESINNLDTTVNSLVDNYNNLYGTVGSLNDTVNKHEDDISRIDETLNNIQENGTGSSVPVYYYNGLHNQENLDMFNEICGLFDNKSPFVLVGRFEVELQTGEDTFEMEEVVTPIQVRNFTDRETGGTVLSFATAPIWLGSQYNIATIGLVGEWGNFTDFQTIGWSALQGPSVNVKTFEGYDETKTQVLKNINGVLTWVEE